MAVASVLCHALARSKFCEAGTCLSSSQTRKLSSRELQWVAQSYWASGVQRAGSGSQAACLPILCSDPLWATSAPGLVLHERGGKSAVGRGWCRGEPCMGRGAPLSAQGCVLCRPVPSSTPGPSVFPQEALRVPGRAHLPCDLLPHRLFPVSPVHRRAARGPQLLHGGLR